MKRYLLFCLMTFAALTTPSECSYTVTGHLWMPEIFSHHMVLQRETPIPVWGRAEAGEEILVSLETVRGSTKVDAKGRWHLDLPPMKAGGPHTLTVSVKSGAEPSVKFEDVLVGEVWLCSGQSNMVFPLERDVKAQEELSRANHPELRLFKMTGVAYPSAGAFSDEQLEAVDDGRYFSFGPWQRCTPETVRPFSAVAYYFGRDLHRSLEVPVGLIHNAIGGSNTESWISREALARHPRFKSLLEDWRRSERIHPWCRRRGMENIRRSKAERPRHPFEPAYLFDAGIEPLVPFAVKGVLWYQGESNAPVPGEDFVFDPLYYRTLFNTLVKDWRAAWGRGDFPFLYVQLPNMSRDWMTFREVQLQSLALPNTGMAVTIDVGDPKDVHPRSKAPVGRRLCLIARARVYGEDLVHYGPMLNRMERHGGELHLWFSHAGGGLDVRGRQELEGFEIAGKDGGYLPAKACIEEAVIRVWNEQIPEPVAVRYAWAPNPRANLINKEGLPASPFRHGEEAFRGSLMGEKGSR